MADALARSACVSLETEAVLRLILACAPPTAHPRGFALPPLAPLQFDEKGMILGAFTSTYLLEKPRIVEHMRGERNYHGDLPPQEGWRRLAGSRAAFQRPVPIPPSPCHPALTRRLVALEASAL